MKRFTYHFSPITRRQAGFGLLEVVLSAGILATVLGASVSLMNSSLRRATLSAERTTAMNLAQEGVELVRAARDTALIDQVSNNWNTLFDPMNGTGAESDVYGLVYASSTSGGTWKLAKTGTSITNGVETIALGGASFERTIAVTSPGIDYAKVAGFDAAITEKDVIRKVTVTVRWGSKTAKESVTSIIYLTNWQGA